MRYSVCLIASTCGSRAACSTKRTTVASKDSYGWWTSRSRSRSVSHSRPSSSTFAKCFGMAGVNPANIRPLDVERRELHQVRRIDEVLHLDHVGLVEFEFVEQQLAVE